jgi:hypothetical protein
MYYKWPFILHFYEAYLSAAPFTCSSKLSWGIVRRVFAVAARDLILRGEALAVGKLGRELGIRNPSLLITVVKAHIAARIKLIAQFSKKMSAGLLQLSHSITRSLPIARRHLFCYRHRSRGPMCLDILASDVVLRRAFKEYQETCLNVPRCQR